MIQVLAARVPVLTLEHQPAVAADAFRLEAKNLDEQVSIVILGCAGAASIATRIDAESPYKVIDGITLAARLIRAIVV